MSDVVVVGPRAVSGPRAVDPELAATALDAVDDQHALVADRVVPVDELWCDVLSSALTDRCAGVVLVCPSWWPQARVERVAAAAACCATHVDVRRRIGVLAPTSPAVVEVASGLVVVHADGQRRAISRLGATDGAVGAIVACVEGLSAVTLDVPAGLARFGADLARALRRRAIEVTVVDDDALAMAARGQRRDQGPGLRRRATPRALAAGAAVLSVAVLSASALALRGPAPPREDVTWLLEGRVAVEVPAQWTVERVTSGPGSARVQVVSPTDGSAIHVTQSRVPGAQTLEQTAEALQGALAEEPDGVFVDFAATTGRAERSAVTYREVRAGRRIDWTVLLDGGVRIAIGCQGPRGAPGPDRQCDRAIRSAHAVNRR